MHIHREEFSIAVTGNITVDVYLADDVQKDTKIKATFIGVDGVTVKGETEYNAYYDEIVGFDSNGSKVGMFADQDCTESLIKGGFEL